MKSTIKFLRNNEWAKDKVENFYLYQFKGFPTPDNKQLSIAPRNRKIPTVEVNAEPAEITSEVIGEIDRAAKCRIYKKAEAKVQKEEPPYNPNNPWNK